MRKFVLLTVFLLLAAGLALIWPSPPPPMTPMPAPDFSYETLAGAKGRLHDLRGKIVLLHVWATWCPPCVEEFPDLVELARRRDDIAVLAITVDHNRQAAETFLARLGPMPANLHVIQDKERAVTYGLFRIYAYPETILIAPDLIMRDKIPGPAPSWTDAGMAARLKALKQERLDSPAP